MPWITRGLSEGVPTSRYPRQPDGYGPTWFGSVAVRSQQDTGREIVTGQVGTGSDRGVVECPTGAISAAGSQITVDRGRCILCARCIGNEPGIFESDPSVEVAVSGREMLVVVDGDSGPALGQEDDARLIQLQASLAKRTRRLHRSIHIRHVDAGSDGSEEWEIAALTNPVYDVQRLGIFFTASPRHADVLLVTGAGSAGMLEPLKKTFDAMPSPKVVIAAGTDAISGGLLAGNYATSGGIGEALPVDVWVPGSPPSPFSLLHAILLAVGLLPARSAGATGSLDTTRPSRRPNQRRRTGRRAKRAPEGQGQ